MLERYNVVIVVPHVIHAISLDGLWSTCKRNKTYMLVIKVLLASDRHCDHLAAIPDLFLRKVKH
jgi:hypothetical protein